MSMDTLKCNACGGIFSSALSRCPACESTDYEVVTGAPQGKTNSMRTR